jgi:hypothetical protein
MADDEGPRPPSWATAGHGLMLPPTAHPKKAAIASAKQGIFLKVFNYRISILVLFFLLNLAAIEIIEVLALRNCI